MVGTLNLDWNTFYVRKEKEWTEVPRATADEVAARGPYDIVTACNRRAYFRRYGSTTPRQPLWKTADRGFKFTCVNCKMEVDMVSSVNSCQGHFDRSVGGLPCVVYYEFENEDGETRPLLTCRQSRLIRWVHTRPAGDIGDIDVPWDEYLIQREAEGAGEDGDDEGEEEERDAVPAPLSTPSSASETAGQTPILGSPNEASAEGCNLRFVDA
ncbi:uncharacterized protein EV422DRAFT_92613 [Fimicolochytrium jonesii]|uniref:uncharacterized protein n=1 Tax=Fimicolochytrium jonesii TaxID=1396493 RepID=UPI0022FF3CE2|nr:uncharacterized protein EV422DRAFT_92613 [Fimicolochytrium jonesii]KAI8819945.1 hypothetical protein EV422DRAFT_92613 [Fimicolochytrium jonesii]